MIVVFSRDSISKFYEEHPDDRTPVISINDIGYESPVPAEHKNALRLFFDDVTPFLVKHKLHHFFYQKEEEIRPLVYFSDEMAQKIIEFIQIQCSLSCSMSDIYIHCYAGVSRSAAVALFIHMLYGNVFGDLCNVDLNDCRLNSYILGKLIKTQKETM